MLKRQKRLTVSEFPFHFPLDVFAPNFSPLVILLFSLAQAYFHFYPPFFKIKRKGYEGVAFFLGLPCDAFYLVPVKEEFFLPIRVVVEHRRKRVFRYSKGAQPDLIARNFRPGVRERDLPVPEGLNFGSQKLYAAFVSFVHRVIKPGLAVQGDDLDPFAQSPFPFGAITGLKDTKGETKEGGRDALVSGRIWVLPFIQEPPLNAFSGESCAGGTLRKESGTNGSSHHSQKLP